MAAFYTRGGLTLTFVSTVLGGIGNLAGAVGISKKMSTAASIIFNETMIVEMIDT